LDSFIRTLPKGLDSVVGEDTSFSGGQEQLLAIGRVLIQQRPFVIFDEGSSQLDVEKEFMVLQLLKELRQSAGILFITHRMSVAKKADYIYVMDKGEIVEEGTHAELLDTKGLYSQFWDMQIIS
jgi:ABC-type multidrug transport system fused ATPase/permease subunit